MILSPNIDLTENGAFSGGNLVFEDIFIDMPIDEYQAMSHEQYEKLICWESIFGKIRHWSRKQELFDEAKKERDYKESLRTHCSRCGKVIKEPWNIFHSVCSDCAKKEEMYSDEWGEPSFIPWKSKDNEIKEEHRIRNLIFNLFNSR